MKEGGTKVSAAFLLFLFEFGTMISCALKLLANQAKKDFLFDHMHNQNFKYLSQF